MANKLNYILKDPVTRHYLRVVAFAVVLGGFLMLGFINRSAWFDFLNQKDAYEPENLVATSSELYSLPRALPTQLRIPKINVDTTFEAPLELNADQTIQVPKSYDKVGWYKLGAAPGEAGTASILGHVDSYEGAEVFYHLGQLEPGDMVYVDRLDGTTATFIVEASERYSQDNFPAEKVYSMTDYPSLRLITCTGTYDHGEQRYSHNLVVFAKLVEGGETAENRENVE